MIEAHVINDRNRPLYEEEWDRYLRIRHDIYVREKGWRPESPDGRETDRFDTSDATYILGIEDGEIVTGARMIPTSKPNLVSEVFFHMCEVKGVPRRRDWADWTRTFVVPSRRSGSRRGILTQIFCAAMDYCLDEGIAYAGGIQETYFMPQFRMMNWHVEPMGMPQVVAGAWSVVAYIRCDEQALAGARRLLGAERPPLIRRGEQRPFIPAERPRAAGFSG
jgi:acyl-homoserine lactone synthase